MKKSIVLSLALAMVLFSSFSFTPAPQIDTVLPTTFTSDMIIHQDLVTNVPDGIGFHGRTTEEKFSGTITSDWSAINGASLAMDELTNYLGFPTDTPNVYNLVGDAHSTIVIATKDSSGTLTLKANGKITGSIDLNQTPPLVILDINMVFSSASGTGSLAKNSAQGTITAHFQTPDGTGKMTGKYQ